jgi:hypothetical protein
MAVEVTKAIEGEEAVVVVVVSAVVIVGVMMVAVVTSSLPALSALRQFGSWVLAL